MASFLIRKALPKDIPIIFDFIKELAAYEKLSNEVTATYENLEKSFFGSVGGPNCLLAFENDVPVGFCIYFYNFSSFLGKQGIYLEDLFVKSSFRGKSYGKKLLLQLVQIAKDENLGRVEWSVLDWNLTAIDFYRSLGARPMDGWTVFRLDKDNIEKLV